MTLTARIAERAVARRYADLSAAAVTAAKTFTLDTLAVGAAGAGTPLTRKVHGVARSWADDLEATVLGHGEQLSADCAAYVNAFSIHCQEYDAVHEPAVVHPLATTLAATLAEAERRGGVTGRQFLTALCTAVDVAAGLGVAAPGPLRFFRPATAGVFGAAAGVARLRGFTPGQLLDAWGHALGQASGTMQAHVEGTPGLPLQIANAARAAVLACDLAGAGLPGPQDALEGPYGYLTLFEDDRADLAAGFDGWPERITQVSHKAYPTGRAAQGGLWALERLKEQGVTADTVRSLTLSAPPLVGRLVRRPATPDMTPAYARLCFPYLAARTLIGGPVSLCDFTEEKLGEPDVLALAALITVTDTDGAPSDFTPQTLTAELTDGSRLTQRVDALPGSPALPLTEAQQDAKVRACLAFSGADADADTLTTYCRSLEDQDDAGRLARLTVGTP